MSAADATQLARADAEALGTFVVLLVVAYVYVWKRGALEWR